jgi:hypothetical protein
MKVSEFSQVSSYPLSAINCHAFADPNMRTIEHLIRNPANCQASDKLHPAICQTSVELSRTGIHPGQLNMSTVSTI